jgi:hypothetical protein
MRRPRGLTMPEIIVSLFLVALLGTTLFKVGLLFRTQAHGIEVTITERERLQVLMRRLQDSFDQTTAEGFYASTDGLTLTIQTIDGLSLNGTRSWSPFITFYHYDPAADRLLTGKVEIGELGKTHQPALPCALVDGDLALMVQTRTDDGKIRPVAEDVAVFEVSQPNPLSAEVKLSSVIKSGKYKDEEVTAERVFFFASAAEV